MMRLIPGLDRSQPISILFLGAHADDIEIGSGGTIMRLAKEAPHAHVHWAVFSARGRRDEEARASAARLLALFRSSELSIFDFMDGYFPQSSGEIKDRFEAMQSAICPDVIFTHDRKDLHQDHRLLGEMTWNTFRDHFILEYEIPKYDGGLRNPNFFVTLSEVEVAEKCNHLIQNFASQRKLHWFSDDLFRGLCVCAESNAGARQASQRASIVARRFSAGLSSGCCRPLIRAEMPARERAQVRLPCVAEIAALDCRFCGTRLEHSFVDLGLSPLCEKYVHSGELNAPEIFYPLHAFVCHRCFLVQVGEYANPAEIFSGYHYLSSCSSSWLQHCEAYTAAISARLNLGTQHAVVELASNDGYLLQYFASRGIPAYGVEPAENVAEIARSRGIDTVVSFFGEATAKRLLAERGPADLIIGNNVLAHVPDINDFVAGMSVLLARDGTITMEFPHLMRLVEENQFDTVYHEHFSYLSFLTAEKIFAAHGLTIYDVEELPTHGGSLRIYARHAASKRHATRQAVKALRRTEREAGVHELPCYGGFSRRAEQIRHDLLRFLINAKSDGKAVVAYGAPGKGNTLLNYCGIRSDLVQFTVDRNPLKQGAFLPGSRIPVLAPEQIDRVKPDFVLILPWNLKAEIMQQLEHIRRWGGRFLTAIPAVTVVG